MRQTLPRTGFAKTRGPAWPIFRRAAGPFAMGEGTIGDPERTPGLRPRQLAPPNPEHHRRSDLAPGSLPGAQRTFVAAGFGVAGVSRWQTRIQALVSMAGLSARAGASTWRLRVKLFGKLQAPTSCNELSGQRKQRLAL